MRRTFSNTENMLYKARMSEGAQRDAAIKQMKKLMLRSSSGKAAVRPAASSSKKQAPAAAGGGSGVETAALFPELSLLQLRMQEHKRGGDLHQLAFRKKAMLRGRKQVPLVAK